MSNDAWIYGAHSALLRKPCAIWSSHSLKVPRGEMVLQVHQTNVSIFFCTISSPALDGVQGTSLLGGFLCQMILLALMLKAGKQTPPSNLQRPESGGCLMFLVLLMEAF